MLSVRGGYIALSVAFFGVLGICCGYGALSGSFSFDAPVAWIGTIGATISVLGLVRTRHLAVVVNAEDIRIHN